MIKDDLYKRKTAIKPVLLGLLILALCIVGIRLMAHREAQGAIARTVDVESIIKEHHDDIVRAHYVEAIEKIEAR